MHAASPSRRRSSFALLIAVALAAGRAASGCADVTPSPLAYERSGGSPPPRAAVAEPGTLGFELAPDGYLQALIDPPARWRGPTWFGGDVASSIEVAPDRYVWIFGDTLIGTRSPACAAGQGDCRRGGRDRETADVIANSAGTMWLSPAGRPRPIVKYWRRGAGEPAPILAETEPGEILWPLAGVRVGSKLLLAVSRHTRESGLVPLGNLFAVVHDPAERPDRWSYELHPVPHVRTGEAEGNPLTWTTALVVEGAYVHVFGMRGEGLEAKTVLCRLRVEDVAGSAWNPRPEYLLAGKGDEPPVWSDRFSLESLYALPGLPGTSEATFEHRGDVGWITFQIPPFGFHIRAYTAPDLRGPWVDGGVLYRIPPPWSTELRTDCLSPEIGCGWERFAAYAAKSHPELAPPGGYAVSYNVNLLFGTLDTAIRAAEEIEGFYVPRMLAGGSLPR